MTSAKSIRIVAVTKLFQIWKRPLITDKIETKNRTLVEKTTFQIVSLNILTFLMERRRSICPLFTLSTILATVASLILRGMLYINV